MNPDLLFLIIAFGAAGVLSLIGYLIYRWRNRGCDCPHDCPPSRCDPPPRKPTPPPPPPPQIKPPQQPQKVEYAELTAYVQQLLFRNMKVLTPNDREIIRALARDGNRKKQGDCHG